MTTAEAFEQAKGEILQEARKALSDYCTRLMSQGLGNDEIEASINAYGDTIEEWAVQALERIAAKLDRLGETLH